MGRVARVADNSTKGNEHAYDAPGVWQWDLLSSSLNRASRNSVKLPVVTGIG